MKGVLKKHLRAGVLLLTVLLVGWLLLPNRHPTPDLTCFASDKIRIQVADRIFEVPRENLNHISLSEGVKLPLDKGSYGKICQRAGDLPFKAKQFTIKADFASIKRQPASTMQIVVTPKGQFTPELTEAIYALPIKEPLPMQCSASAHGEITGTLCETFFALDNSIAIKYWFLDKFYPRDTWKALQEKVVEYLENLSRITQ